MPTIFSTTFDVPEWIQSSFSSPDPAGDDLSILFDTAQTSTGKYAQIHADANHAAGGGGRGFRQWVANGGDGSNDQSGGLRIGGDTDFLIGESHIWTRHYQRWQSGLRWVGGNPSYSKDLDFDEGTTRLIAGFQGSGGEFGVWVDGTSRFNSAYTWNDLMGGNTSDGAFHCIEWELGQNTGGANTGIVRLWIDNVFIAEDTTCDITAGDWATIHIQVNQNGIANAAGTTVGGGGAAKDWAIDFDDMVISNSSRVGPLAGGGFTGARNTIMRL